MRLIILIVVSVMIIWLIFIVNSSLEVYQYSEYIKSDCVETDLYYSNGSNAGRVYDCSNLLVKENK